MAVRIESQRVVWHARPPATTLRGLIPRGPGRLGARRTGRESSRASLTTSRVVWEFAQVLCSTRLASLPGLMLGRERKPHAAVRHPMKRVSRLRRRGPEVAPTTTGSWWPRLRRRGGGGGRMPHEK